MFPIGDQNEPGLGTAWITLGLIAINVGVFLLLQQATADNAFTWGYSAVPLEITTGRDIVAPISLPIGGQSVLIPHAPGPSPIQLTVLTSMFMHGGWLHLGGNMLFLWIFGDNVEHFAGAVVFLVVYLVTGVIATLAQVLVSPDSIIPSLGASGAISGVLGAYIVLFPRNRVTVFVFRFLVVVPAIVAIGLWAVLQFVSGLGSAAAETGGVAYAAHIGGFIAGVAAGVLLLALFGRNRSRRAVPGG
jgi:membrane associated rhomboid family serine protease